MGEEHVVWLRLEAVVFQIRDHLKHRNVSIEFEEVVLRGCREQFSNRTDAHAVEVNENVGPRSVARNDLLGPIKKAAIVVSGVLNAVLPTWWLGGGPSNLVVGRPWWLGVGHAHGSLPFAAAANSQYSRCQEGMTIRATMPGSRCSVGDSAGSITECHGLTRTKPAGSWPRRAALRPRRRPRRASPSRRRC